MAQESLDQRERKERMAKLALAAVVLLLFGYCKYEDHKEIENIRAHNARLFTKFKEIKKDYKFLKLHVKEFESTNWQRAVPDVKDMTQILGKDLQEFDNLLQQNPLGGYQREEEE